MGSEIDVEQLKKKISERMALIKKFVEFAEMIVRERGRQVHYEEHSAHTNIVSQLENFAGFSFRVNSGMTEHGGNTVEIWDGFISSPETLRGDFNPLVFSIYYQVNIDDCRVDVFKEHSDWIDRLEGVIERKDQIIAQLEKEKKDNEERRRQEIASDNKLTELVRCAERLKVKIP